MHNILFCCQVLDKSDPAMGFFHEWIKCFSPSFNKVTVIALKIGSVELPANVRYFSLGKEKYAHSPLRRLRYTIRLIELAWKNRKEYDGVFVHMNQEFILVSGLLWKLTGKQIYLWHNHYSGNIFTNIVAKFCKKIFFTSKSAYTSRFPQAVQMPVGVDTSSFVSPARKTERNPVKILFLARISKSKRLEDLIMALAQTPLINMNWSLRVTGPTISAKDEAYLSECKKMIVDLNLSSRLIFTNGIPFAQTRELYSTHDIFINCSKSGMYDKTIFEAAASGCLVVSPSKDFRNEAGDNFFFNFGNDSELSRRLVNLINQSSESWGLSIKHMREIAGRHSLEHLLTRIIQEIYG